MLTPYLLPGYKMKQNAAKLGATRRNYAMQARTRDLCLAGICKMLCKYMQKNGRSHVVSVRRRARDLAFHLLSTGVRIDQVGDLIRGSFENHSQTKADARSS